MSRVELGAFESAHLLRLLFNGRAYTRLGRHDRAERSYQRACRFVLTRVVA